MNPDIKIDVESVKKVLTEEVIKRELFEGDKANDANKRINKFLRSQLSNKKEKDSEISS